MTNETLFGMRVIEDPETPRDETRILRVQNGQLVIDKIVNLQEPLVVREE